MSGCHQHSTISNRIYGDFSCQPGSSHLKAVHVIIVYLQEGLPIVPALVVGGLPLENLVRLMRTRQWRRSDERARGCYGQEERREDHRVASENVLTIEALESLYD